MGGAGTHNRLHGGNYSFEDLQRIYNINSRPSNQRKPEEAFYKKSADEHGPSWAEKREFVHHITYNSTVSPACKKYLKELEFWPEKYQLRGFKYGLVGSGLVFFFFPVIRR